MKKLSLIAILTSIMIMASSAFCFADGGFDLVSSYPEDGQTNTSMENLGVKLTFSKPLSSAEAQKANADKLAIYDEDGKAVPVQILFSNDEKGLVLVLADVDKASIAVRNFPLSVAELRMALKIGDGDEVYLFATTLRGENKVIIRTKKTASDEAVLFG